MSIQPQRSKFKKSTATYFKDNLLDIIDISETLSKNRYIHKCSLNNFIFSKYISNYKLSKECFNLENKNMIYLDNQINNENVKNNNEENKEEFNYDNINFEILNQNKFHINFTKLKLEYENGYSILFIVNVFGIKGEVKLYNYSDRRERFEELNEIILAELWHNAWHTVFFDT